MPSAGLISNTRRSQRSSRKRSRGRSRCSVVLPGAITRQLRKLPLEQAAPWEDFWLMRGGPLHRLAAFPGLSRSRFGFVYLGLAIAFLAWVPLVVLAAAAQMLTSGTAVPFLLSVGTHVRLLVAMPLLFLAEVMFERRVQEAIRTVVRSGLVPEEQLPRLRQALVQAAWWRDTWIVEAALAVLTAILILEGVRTDLPGALTTWRAAADGTRTLAGWWYEIVSLPLFQFLLWRWMARLLVWGQLLWRIRRLDLQLVPTHPDLAGGLAPLGDAHVSLGPLSFAVAAILVATFAEEVMRGHADVR